MEILSLLVPLGTVGGLMAGIYILRYKAAY